MRPQSCMVTYRSMRTAPGDAIDLDAAEIEDEAVAERAVDLVGLGRRASSSGGVQNTVSRMAPDRRRGSRPGDQWLVAASRENESALSGLSRGRMRPSANAIVVGGDVELRRRDARELGRAACARQDAPRRRPPPRSGWNNCRRRSTRHPCAVSSSVMTRMSGGLQAEHVGDDLRQHGAVALALRHRGDMHRHRAERVERHRRGRLRAVLRAGLAPLLPASAPW